MSKRAPVNIEGDLAALISSALLNEQSTSLTTILKLLSKDGDALEVTRAWSLLQSYYRALYDRSADVVGCFIISPLLRISSFLFRGRTTALYGLEGPPPVSLFPPGA